MWAITWWLGALFLLFVYALLALVSLILVKLCVLAVPLPFSTLFEVVFFYGIYFCRLGLLQSHFFIWLSAFFFGVAFLGWFVWLGPSRRAYEATLYALWLLPLTLPHLWCVLFRTVLFYLVLFCAWVVLGGFMQYYASCVVGYGVAFTMRCICGRITA